MKSKEAQAFTVFVSDGPILPLFRINEIPILTLFGSFWSMLILISIQLLIKVPVFQSKYNDKTGSAQSLYMFC